MREEERVRLDIEMNIKAVLDGTTPRIGLDRANSCLLGILCEMLLDIRELMKTWR